MNTGEPRNNVSHPDYAPCLLLNGAVGELSTDEANRSLRRLVVFTMRITGPEFMHVCVTHLIMLNLLSVAC